MTVHGFSSMGCDVLVGGATAAELRSVEQLFDERDRMFSRFRRDSELSRVNRSSGLVVAVSAPFAEMVDIALGAAAMTNGIVDPTLGDAIEAAGYDRDFRHLESCRSACGGTRGRRQDIWMRSGYLFRPRDLQLDLNGVVKGKTIDDALQLIAADDGFVSAGGDVVARGPLDVSLPGGGAVRVVAGGLATSGTAKRRWLQDGVWQHHLIDPRTGRPSESPWFEVTVGAATCLQADIAAKAAFLLGFDGPRFLEERGLAGRFLRRNGGVVCTSRWRSSVATQDAVA
jgi:FAD:protein FMN transferase